MIFSMFFSGFTLIDKLINGINTLEQPLTALKSFSSRYFNVFLNKLNIEYMPDLRVLPVENIDTVSLDNKRLWFS